MAEQLHLGHPLGATGSILTFKLISELKLKGSNLESLRCVSAGEWEQQAYLKFYKQCSIKHIGGNENDRSK